MHDAGDRPDPDKHDDVSRADADVLQYPGREPASFAQPVAGITPLTAAQPRNAEQDTPADESWPSDVD